jgi:hypothetical protein
MLNFRNGLAFCALVHRLHPESLDFASLDPNNIQENNQLGISFVLSEILAWSDA